MSSLICYADELQKFHSNEHAVFTNSEFSLGHINVYGFDFDYTLVQYGNEVHKFAYEQARDMLIKKLNVSNGFLHVVNNDYI